MVPVLAVSVFGWIVLVAIWIALAFWPARVAGRKGHSFIGYFIFSLFFFPLALLVAYMVGDRTRRAARSAMPTHTTRERWTSADAPESRTRWSGMRLCSASDRKAMMSEAILTFLGRSTTWWSSSRRTRPTSPVRWPQS